MSAVELNEAFFAGVAGWEAMKQARALVEQGAVLSSNWTPPILKGVVQEGSISYRAGLVIKSSIELENMCGCRAARQWGTICAHSVAVGLHHLNRGKAPAAKPAAPTPSAAKATAPALPSARASAKRLQRAQSAEAEEAELFVILPPALAQSIPKDKIMVCLEAKWSKGRMPLTALPLHVRFRFSPQEDAFLSAVEEIAGDTPALLVVSRAQFARLLEHLRGHPRVTLGKGMELELSSEPWRVPLSARLEESGEIRLSLGMSPGAPPVMIAGEKLWVLQGESIRPILLPKVYWEVFQKTMIIPRSRVPQLLGQDWPRLLESADLRASFKVEEFTFAPQPPKFHLHLAGGLAQLQAQLQCAYGPRIMTIGVSSPDESLWLPDPSSPKAYSTRDLAAEQEALTRLTRYGFSRPDAQGRLQLASQNHILTFFAREYPKLQREWSVTLEERLSHSAAKNLEWIEPKFQIMPSGEQWFDLDVSYSSSGGERFSAADIQRLMLSGQSHARTKSGKFALIDTGAVEELQEVLLDCNPEQHSGRFRMENNRAGFLDATLRQNTQWQLQAPAEWKSKAAQQSGETKRTPPPLGALGEVLRPYQKDGVGWLLFLRENDFGGILADEMGLGKTLQTLAFLAVIASAKKEARDHRPHLVVCPTSLVWNWMSEAKKFTPQIKTLVLHGPDRHAAFAEMDKADLIVTSYALLRRDADQYRGMEFDTVVLDEAQHIKNRQTQNAQAVKSIRASHRVVLTGTPLENSVLDLWSIFDFLMPGYLGAAKDFRERYEAPIVREKDAKTQARLARRVRPFLLRRLKREVAKDLPDKIEQVSYCELTEDQRAVYQGILEAGRKEMLDAAGQPNVQKSRLAVLNAILRLRQACCDLRLLPLEKVDPHSASGKLDLFSELLEEALDGGHRVLVFSQFVSMLQLIKERLDEELIPFCYLDGSTRNRAEVVQKFQTSQDIPVFLISLKAGGVGLNLTGADTVIHFDPWWNPAVEDQATDRAHRIGQNRVVTSYKLIARGTVEEKILSLQARKRALIKGMLESEEAFAESLTWEEIQDLLGGD